MTNEDDITVCVLINFIFFYLMGVNTLFCRLNVNLQVQDKVLQILVKFRLEVRV